MATIVACGTRPLVVELQALVSTSYASPDGHRHWHQPLASNLAVLEKHLGLPLSGSTAIWRWQEVWRWKNQPLIWVWPRRW